MEMISNVKGNLMGTVSFDGLFPGQRKAQDFIVYPMDKATHLAKVQSDKRAGFINLVDGEVKLSKNQYDFTNVVRIDILPLDQLMALRNGIIASASKKAGKNGVVYCDNGAAALI